MNSIQIYREVCDNKREQNTIHLTKNNGVRLVLLGEPMAQCRVILFILFYKMDSCFFDSNDVLPLHGNINSMSRTENVISGYKYAYTGVPNL